MRAEDLVSVGTVPRIEDRQGIFSWAFGQVAFRSGALDPRLFDDLMDQMAWFRITETRNSWSGDANALSQMTSSMLTGLWHTGATVALSASGGRGGLDLRIGTLSVTPSSVVSTVRAALPGTRIELPQSYTPPSRQKTGALRAVVDPTAEPSAPGILDRLTSLEGTDWALTALLIPISRQSIADYLIELAALATALGNERTSQVTVTQQLTRTSEDPLVARLLEVVEGEYDRALQAQRTGAYGVAITLSAPDDSQFSSTVGAASGASPSASTGWAFVDTSSPDALLPLSSLTCTELVDLMRPPVRDVYGLPSRSWRPLDEHPEQEGLDDPRIRLGGTEQGAAVELDHRLIGHHILVTGGTGSGKSTFVARLLVQLAEHSVPFLIIEPVKDEWRSLTVLGSRHWMIGAADPLQSWGLNPLEPGEGTPVATHIDHLVSLFRSAFGLPDPLPYLVELGLQRVYSATGWDLSSNRYLGREADTSSVEWPTISDLIEECLALPAELGYDHHIQGNLRAALRARLEGLIRGPRGRLLDTQVTFPIHEVLQTPVVVNLDNIGDDHARSFVMGLLLIRLVEHRRRFPSQHLDHVTFVEEAHRLMGRSTSGSSPDGQMAGGSGSVGGTTTMFAQLLGEIRATGEGLIIADQSPKELVRAAIVNTGTQVALRANDHDDQEALGSAMGLEPDQQLVLSGLRTHEAIVSTEGMDLPVRVNLDWVPLSAPDPSEQSQFVSAPPSRIPARMPDTPAEVTQAVGVLIRVNCETDRTAALERLQTAVRSIYPDVDAETLDELVTDVVGRAIRSLSRSRRWNTKQRDSAQRAVQSGCFDGDHPCNLLVGGSRAAGAGSGVSCHEPCLVSELIEPEAQRLLAEGPAAITRLVADPREAYHRLLGRALSAVPPWAPEHLRDSALRCLATQVFSDWGDPAFVTQLVDEVVKEGRDGAL